MFYHLVKNDGTTLDVKEHPEDLEFSRLHNCTHWSIWIHWENDIPTMIAEVNWSGSRGYVLNDYYAMERLYITQHSKILPIVRACVVYHSIFNRYNIASDCKKILVYPEPD